MSSPNSLNFQVKWLSNIYITCKHEWILENYQKRILDPVY